MPNEEEMFRVGNPSEIMRLSSSEIHRKRKIRELAISFQANYFPKKHLKKGLSQKNYDIAKRGLSIFCVDVVITTFVSPGLPAVLYTMRSKENWLGGYWFNVGGVNFPASDPEQHLSYKTVKELGFPVLIESPMSTWINTNLAKNPKSNMQPYIALTAAVCYAGWVPFEVITKHLTLSPAHTDARFFTHKELKQIPSHQQHPYPMVTTVQALIPMLEQHYSEMKRFYFEKFSEYFN